MESGQVIDLFSHSITMVMMIVAVILVPGLCVGLTVAIFQAVTQINEMTLSFIPRLFVTIMVLIVAGPWILDRLIDFTKEIIHNIPYMIG